MDHLNSIVSLSTIALLAVFVSVHFSAVGAAAEHLYVSSVTQQSVLSAAQAPTLDVSQM